MNLQDYDSLERYVPHVFVLVMMAYMTWIRLLPRDRAISDGQVFFTANDPWYHIRVNEFIAANYPATFPFDVYTHFPYGSFSSTGFGGLFNQITVFFAMIVGLGDPSQYQLELVTAFAPVAFGAACAVPVYLVARQVTDRVYALVAVLSLALVTGQFLNRTTFGNAQHQSAEAFFITFAVFGLLFAVNRAYTEKPTVAHLQDRDWEGLKPAFTGVVVGALALSMYVLTWPAGIFVVVPFGLAIVVQMVRDHVKGRPTEYLALVTGGVFLLAAVPVMLYVLLMGLQFRIHGASFSSLQPITLAATGAGILFLHGVATYLESEDYSREAYPAAVGALFLVGIVFLWLTGLIEMFESLVTRIYSFGYLASPGAQTIAEQSPARWLQGISEFGLLFVMGLLGLIWALIRVVTKNRPLELILLLWGATMYSAYFTQSRFGYYVALAVAVFTAYGIYHAVKLLDLDDLEIEVDSLENLGESVLDVKGYQVIAIVMILFLFLPVLVFPIGAGMSPAWESVRAGGDQPWQQDALDWMEDNTPEPEVDYLENYPTPEDGDFDYPVDESPLEGSYGVISWWDYGHWIMHVGQRVPNANPFQQGNQMASDYLVSQSEERSNLILDALPSLEPDPHTHEMSDDELRDIVDQQGFQEANEDTRYVMIDDQMAAGKFGAIGTWTGFTGEDYIDLKEIQLGENFTESLPATGDGYDETTLSRLYFDDARSMESYRLVHETETYGMISSSVDLGTGQQQVNQLFMRDSYDGEIPGTGLSIQEAGQMFQRDQAMPAGGNAYLYDIRAEASVKTYERVEGAKLTGEANASDELVFAIVNLETENTDRSFSYVQNTTTDEDGEFEMTVPYASEHDVGVDEGGTNSAVEPEGPYEVYVGQVGVAEVLGDTQVIGEPEETGNVDVTESDVYFGETVDVELVEIDEEDLERPEIEEEDIVDEEQVEDEGIDDAGETIDGAGDEAGAEPDEEPGG